MYSHQENINILTALLVSYGIKHAVVCPGSRNAAIVHNLNECPNIACYPVTDERSAGFYALGMAQCLGEPVVVCVTSGTALLNLVPAVAEAFYQHVPIVVVSADRPVAWIDQQDGQTLPQPDALGRFVRKAVSLPEPTNDEHHWYSNRLVNEALIACKGKGCGPVHINIPLSEPLFKFDVPTLSPERVIQKVEAKADVASCQLLFKDLQLAKRPMIVVGQQSYQQAKHCYSVLNELAQEIPVVYECLGIAIDDRDQKTSSSAASHFKPSTIDQVLLNWKRAIDNQPDLIIYIGGSFLSKRLKLFLRKSPSAKTWIVNEEGAIYDTFMNLTGSIEGDASFVLKAVQGHLKSLKVDHHHVFDSDFQQAWKDAFNQADAARQRFHPSYSQLQAVAGFFEHAKSKKNYHLHAGNSMSVRLINIFAEDYVYCNRGVNGIEGSLSTAAGFSLVTDDDVYCVIGDLSFFYDQNALWHALNPNFKVLLLNNGGGGIFRSLPGLKDSDAHQTLISAQHTTTARGICEQNHVQYLSASDEKELEENMDIFFNQHYDRPVVLEVFTSQGQDEQAMNEYHQA